MSRKREKPCTCRHEKCSRRTRSVVKICGDHRPPWPVTANTDTVMIANFCLSHREATALADSIIDAIEGLEPVTTTDNGAP